MLDRRRLLVLLLTLPAWCLAQPDQDVFESRVRPLLAERCHACHAGAQKMAGVDLSKAGGADPSRILGAVRYDGRIKMPPTGKLPESDIAAIEQWVSHGGRWPQSAGAQPATGWWSFQPIRKVDAGGIDDLLRGQLAEAGLDLAPAADPLTLLRRVTHDLTGLPPSEEELREFQADHSAPAWKRVIERLLDSPRYGERWGRHWLDVARYADSTGADEDHRYPHAWRYRDYTIQAFQRDLPYDQFIREQIAGDLLPAPHGGVNVQGIVATGFLALGPKLIAEQDKKKMFYDIVDEQIDVTSRAFLGLTLACARCHDHKFDPISAKDYYSLAAIFASTKQLAKIEGTVSQLYYAPLVERDIAQRWDEHKQKTEAKQKEIDRILSAENARYRDAMAPRIAEYMLAARGEYLGRTSNSQELDRDLLQRWVDYLKPAKDRRPHLEAFYNADPARVSAVALDYQRDVIETARQRKAAPEKMFLPGDNRFYTEATMGKGPLVVPEKQRDALFTEESRRELARLKAEHDRMKREAPPEPPLACAVGEGDPVDQRVFVRGNPESLGDPVTKRFPVVLAGGAQTPIERGSGRRELAEWIASPANPLTARVMVNRIWQGHFGEGLVRTPSNFGKMGEKPTHPELLDWLASRFIADGWSVKAMHRLILTSAAYRQSASNPAAAAKDPDNRLYSRFSRRRLAVEEIRDSLLAIDGALDLTVGGSLQKGEGTDKEFSDDRKSLHPDQSKRRTVYLPLRRSNLPSLLNLFDFGDATTSGEGRAQTNVAPQALFMMNSEFVRERAGGLARQLESAPDDAGRIERVWWRVLGRPPVPAESAAAIEYIRRFPGEKSLAWTSYCRTLLASNEFLYVH